MSNYPTRKSFKSLLRDRPKHSGKLVAHTLTPRKGGAGKGNVGRPGDEVNQPAVDRADPNWTDGEEEDESAYFLPSSNALLPSSSSTSSFSGSIADYNRFKDDSTAGGGRIHRIAGPAGVRDDRGRAAAAPVSPRHTLHRQNANPTHSRFSSHSLPSATVTHRLSVAVCVSHPDHQVLVRPHRRRPQRALLTSSYTPLSRLQPPHSPPRHRLSSPHNTSPTLSSSSATHSPNSPSTHPTPACIYASSPSSS